VTGVQTCALPIYDPTIVVVTATKAEVAATLRIGNIQLFREVVFWIKGLVTRMLKIGA
jgi:hypothetical protein